MAPHGVAWSRSAKNERTKNKTHQKKHKTKNTTKKVRHQEERYAHLPLHKGAMHSPPCLGSTKLANWRRIVHGFHRIGNAESAADSSQIQRNYSTHSRQNSCRHEQQRATRLVTRKPCQNRSILYYALGYSGSQSTSRILGSMSFKHEGNKNTPSHTKITKRNKTKRAIGAVCPRTCL